MTRPHRIAALALTALGACRGAPAAVRPEPVRNATPPARVVAESAPADWREVPADELLVMELGDGGRVVIQLAPAFAPVHVANVRALARGGGWARASVYRVQDNYVTQWGNGGGGGGAPAAPPAGVVEQPPAEFERTLDGVAPRPLAYADPYAAATGHWEGWPVAYDPRARAAWIPHCYGTVAAARGNTPSTGSGSELYAVIGHAPRQLDRNLAVVGRVLDGMAHLSARPRGSGNLGFYDRARGETPQPIVRVRLASDVPEAERPRYEVMRTDGAAFAAYLAGSANRHDAFFAQPAGGVDVCNARVPTRPRPAAR
ncbi:peptidylprolyl isomerase [Roseisolibacter sp. H3M3-2]|uniref:peptidylprolyl isomerase n=1 Tax=Roseisolibacter sp. H3M3-2 TaxID=3031323 RepID=UPI0023DC97DC|nr:peptidylprolyl isomerase [Roseisolibacter sp. H3M3-2]MDF1503815.1 peptidylprolyl isomerase [Roseisolibacter sp. H3M3-2]